VKILGIPTARNFVPTSYILSNILDDIINIRVVVAA